MHGLFQLAVARDTNGLYRKASLLASLVEVADQNLATKPMLPPGFTGMAQFKGENLLSRMAKNVDRGNFRQK